MAKSGTHFHFKQFSVRHDSSTMKVGTDAVLLGAWADVRQARRMLDIGTGSGVIALMLAQRTGPDAHIDAVEIADHDCKEAADNVAASPWPGKVSVHHTSIQDFSPSIFYDVIVSNPPYFNNSLAPPDARRGQTRHTLSLDHHDLLRAALRLLAPLGTLNVVLPPVEGHQFLLLAEASELYCARSLAFRSRAEKTVERVLMEFRRHPCATERSELVLYDEGAAWSAAYCALTRDFYVAIP